MTYEELNRAILRDEVTGRLLPMQLKRTYPRFSLENGELCAAFAGVPMKPGPEGVLFCPPRYYLKIRVKPLAVRTYVTLSGGEDPKPMPPAVTEEIRELADRCGEVLRLLEEDPASLPDAVEEYNERLGTVLDSSLTAVLDRFGGLGSLS